MIYLVELHINDNLLFSADGNVHILLEYCSQKSLLHVMKNRKVLTEPEVRYYMYQICEGVRYLHRKTILHRDLKLGNMFLTWDMMVKIGDFGLATQHQTSLSSASTLCGTPNYIAPEVLKKQGHGYEVCIISKEKGAFFSPPLGLLGEPDTSKYLPKTLAWLHFWSIYTFFINEIFF